MNVELKHLKDPETEMGLFPHLTSSLFYDTCEINGIAKINCNIKDMQKKNKL